MNDGFAYVSDDSPAGLADLWCFHSTRRKFGIPRDSPQDMTFEFMNMLEMGFSATYLRNEILRRGRDRSEQIWQFRDRLKLIRFGDPKRQKTLPGPQTQHYRPEPPLSDEERERAAQVWRQARGLE